MIPKRMTSGIKLFSIALLFLAASHSWAIENRLVRCAKVIAALRADHSVPSISESATSEALRLAHQFRVRFLQDYDFSPGNDAIIATSKSSRRLQQLVARRLSALLKERSGSGIDPNTGEGVQEKIMASVYEGRDNILNELQKRRGLGREMHSGSMRKVDRFNVFVGMPGITAAIFTFAGLVQNPLIPALLTLPVREIPEEALRGFQLYSYGRTFENRAAANLLRLEKDGWFYQSTDQAIDMEVTHRLLATGDLTETDFAIFYLNTIYPRVTYAGTGTRFFAKHIVIPEPGPKSWIRLDEMGFIDPQAQQPVLIDVVRVVKNIPPLPKPVPEKVKVEVPVGALEPSKIPIR